MMKFVKIALLCMFLTISAPAMALDSADIQSAGFNSLTAQQQAEIVSTVATMKERATNPTDTVQKVNEWVTIGANIGKGLAGAAQELGVAVNQFAETSVGKMVTFLIVWHFFGSALVHLLGGIAVFITGMFMVRYLSIHYQKQDEVYDEARKDIFGRAVLKSRSRSGLSGETTFFLGVMYVVVVGISCAVGFTS